MSVLIRNMEMPRPKLAGMVAVYNAYIVVRHNGEAKIVVDNEDKSDSTEYPLVLVPEHGRLIDADKLHEATYHRAFETDGDTMWQSGCWVRYRAIEQVQDSQPTIIEAEAGA